MAAFEPQAFGKYFLVDKIATGGMAEIFKAKTYSHGGFENLLVIKRILPHIGENDDFIEYKSYRATESCPPPDGERTDEGAFNDVHPGEEFVVLVSRKDFEGPLIRKFVINIQICAGSSCI